MKLKALKPKANLIEPTVHIGKEGLTDTVRQEMLMQLKKKKIIKIRMLKSSKPECAKQFARELASSLNATLVQQIGNTITLYREK